LEQYIADFEDIIISDSDDEDAVQYFDDLSSISSMIDDAKLIEFESNELFLTSLGELQNTEFVNSSFVISSLFNSLINSLANKAFEHRLILKNITNVSVNESFDFTYISTIESRYDDREFKEILMNCDAARQSTADIEQFTALQRLNDSMQLDKSIVESKIQFGIDSTSLAVGLGFGQKFKPDPRVGVRPGWTDQSSQPDPRVGVRRVLPSLSETSYIWKGEKKFFVSSI
jgi:hypothetical protein